MDSLWVVCWIFDLFRLLNEAPRKDLEEELNQKRDESHRLSERLAEIESQNGELTARSDEYRAQVERLESVIRELDEKLNQLGSSAENEKNSLRDSLNEALTRANVRINLFD